MQSCLEFIGPTSGCTVSGTWWLDLDAAEVAHPGVFIRQPLTITLLGGTVPGAGVPFVPGDASMSAVLEKK